MQYAFQDYNNLYLVLDLLTGGDLRYQIGHHHRQFFSEQQTKFFISCIVEALIYIHSKNIIHRDIKPENLVFDDKGYLHITDFGIAKFKSKNNKNETSGTPGYMAPEVMKGMNHTGSVDYFAVGVITYELMMGQRPYIGKSRKEIKEQMMSKQIYIDEEMLPFGYSGECADFINRLLIRKDIKRIGYNNDLEIKNHPWFSDINFEELVKKNINAPFLPRNNHDNYDKKYCEEIEKIGYETNYRYEEYKANENYQDIFYGFTFYNIDEAHLQIYKKPNIKYSQNIQNQKYRMIENIKEREFKTINAENFEKMNKIKKEIVVIRKKRTIDIDNKIKNNDKETIDVDDENCYGFNDNKSNKNINIWHDNKKQKDKKNNVSKIHKRMKSNLIRHNYLYFLQKKKLLNLNIKANSFQNISINDSNSIHNNSQQKINHSINYHKSNKYQEKKIIHGHANSFSNNLYINLLKKLKNEKNANEENIDINQLIENTINMDKLNQKKTIELNEIPRLYKIYNNNYKSLKNIKNKSDIFSSIDNTESISSNNNNDINQKAKIMKASNYLNIRQKIPHNKLKKNPINLRNKNMLLNINYNLKSNNSINDDKAIINSRRAHIKVRTKSFSGKQILNYSNEKIKLNKMIPLEGHSLEKKHIFVKRINSTDKKKLLNSNQKTIKDKEIKHNYSYSNINDKNKINSLIQKLIELEKFKTNTIPINNKKTNKTLVNSKVSSLHKKIPIPSSFGHKILHKRMNGYISKKLKIGIKNSFSTSINNNSLNNSNLSKIIIVNNNTSINKSIGKDGIKKNNPNNNNTSINEIKKKSFKSILNKNQNNFNYLLKKLNEFSKKHKKNMSGGGGFNFINNKKDISKGNKNNHLKRQNKIRDKIYNIGNNDKLINIDKNEHKIKKENNEIKSDYNHILNHNVLVNKKISNCNLKNKYNSDNKIFKSNIGNFSYPSYNSTTSSGGKLKNK